MKHLIIVACIIQVYFEDVICINETLTNSSDPNKDMYVIHATVYQVGIITNKTDDKAVNSTMGNQEAVTFFHTNGSKVDLSGIPAPLVTNITAQSMVQVAPMDAGNMQKPPISWADLKHLASLPQSRSPANTENGGIKIVRRSIVDDLEPFENEQMSVNEWRGILKREAISDKSNVKVVKGSAVIPAAAGVRSVALPPLLTLNNNLSEIPVPIPNTSVVRYAKINTLIRQP